MQNHHRRILQNYLPRVHLLDPGDHLFPRYITF